MTTNQQARATRGSQKWLQDLVNDCPKLLDAAIRRETSEISTPIRWVSPLAGDDFAEYRDAEFLEKLGVSLNDVPLDEFWPSRGPQWDALGKTSDGQIILLEAKAHVEEMVSSPIGATSENSLALIRESLETVKSHVKSSSPADWSTAFYQYNNRLAHLYLLRTLNGIPAFLVNLHFLNADEMASERTVPKTVDEWKSAITLQERFLGIRPKHALSRYAIHAFVDTRDIRWALEASPEWSSE